MINFTPSQERAIKEIKEFAKSKEQVLCLTGSPGTGKTFLINHLKNTISNSVVCATTNKASILLNAQTVHNLFKIRVKNNYKTGKTEYEYKSMATYYNTFIIIDECSMLEKELWEVISSCNNTCKFLLVGDKDQLPAVTNPANVFENYRTIALVENMRQKEQDLLDLISKAKEGITNNKIIRLEKSISVDFKTKEEMEDLLTNLTPSDKYISYMNKDAIAMGNHIRALKGITGVFQAGEVAVSRNFCKSLDNKEAVKVEEEVLITSVSEVINFKVNDKVTIRVREVTLEGKNGIFYIPESSESYSNCLSYLGKNRLFVDYFTVKEHILDLRTIWSSTVHCAQGSTYNTVVINLNDIHKCSDVAVTTKLIYVALSRAKEKIIILKGNK